MIIIVENSIEKLLKLIVAGAIVTLIMTLNYIRIVLKTVGHKNTMTSAT